MKNKYYIVNLVLLIILTACSAQTVEENQNDVIETHEPTNISEYLESIETYETDMMLYCDVLSNNNIIEFNSNYFVLEDGTFYSWLYGDDLYSSGQQCKKTNIDKKFESIKTNFIHYGLIQTNDKGFYHFRLDEKYEGYLETETMPDSDEIYFYNNSEIVSFSRFSFEPLKNADSTTSEYFVLRNDGNLYKDILSVSYNDAKSIQSKIAFSNEVYGEIKAYKFHWLDLLDSSAGPDSGSDILFFITEDSFYYRKEVVTNDCKNFVDVKCEIDYVKSKLYEKYKDEIKFINTQYVVLKNNVILRPEIFAKYDLIDQ